MKDGYVIDPDDHRLLDFRRNLVDWIRESIGATTCSCKPEGCSCLVGIQNKLLEEIK